MKASLLQGFPQTDKSSWKHRVEKELKSRSYEDVLYKPAESVTMEPYYVEHEMEVQARYQDIQAAQKQDPGWLSAPVVEFDSPLATNQKLGYHLERGAEALWIDAGDVPLTHLELHKLLYSIRLTDTPVFINSSVSPTDLIGELAHWSGYFLKGGIVSDPIALWMRSGNSLEGTFESIAEGMELTKAMQEFRSFKVESHIFHEAGADVVQELAYTLASFVTYLDRLTDQGLSPLLAATRCVFSISVGCEYLTEISKLRALRYLYRRIIRAYGLPDELCQAFIHCQSSRLYQSSHAPHTNLIRGTSEAMSAVIGGCDVLSIEPHDSFQSEPSGSSERIAASISLILKKEGYLDKVADPAEGAYYLEIQTQKLADAAWEMFLGIEQEGGLLKAFEKNLIQEEIKKSWNGLVAKYQAGKVLVGANKYQEENQIESTPAQPQPTEISPSWEYALLRPHTLDKIF